MSKKEKQVCAIEYNGKLYRNRKEVAEAKVAERKAMIIEKYYDSYIRNGFFTLSTPSADGLHWALKNIDWINEVLNES